MRFTNREVLLVTLACCLGGNRFCFGQGTPSDAASLSVIDTQSETLNGSHFFIVTIKNTSQKPVVGFLALCSLVGANGDTVEKVQMGGVTLDPNVERHDPGTTWKIQVEGLAPDHPEIDIQSVRVEFDYVLFRDLTSAGRNTSKRGNLMRREYEGSQMQLARLRKILRTQGIDAVREVLAKDEPRFARFQ